MKRVLLSMVVLAGLAITTTSCGKAKDAAKNGIEATKDAAKATGDAVKDAADKTVEATKDAANAVKDGADKVADAVANTADNTKQIAEGKALFASKTCTTCHGIDKKILGPSVKDIVKVYNEKGANMVKFLKGNAKAIVDTNPGQVAIMKANIDGFLKEMPASELQALTAYMRSVAK